MYQLNDYLGSSSKHYFCSNDTKLLIQYHPKNLRTQSFSPTDQINFNKTMHYRDKSTIGHCYKTSTNSLPPFKNISLLSIDHPYDDDCIALFTIFFFYKFKNLHVILPCMRKLHDGLFDIILSNKITNTKS